MFGFFAIFSASLAGYAQLPLWAIGATVIALTSISYRDHRDSYEHAREIGASKIADGALLRSALNALLASGAAYGFGHVLRLV